MLEREPGQAVVQTLEKQAACAVDRKHPQVRVAAEPPVAEPERVGQAREPDLDRPAEEPICEKPADHGSIIGSAMTRGNPSEAGCPPPGPHDHAPGPGLSDPFRPAACSISR